MSEKSKKGGWSETLIEDVNKEPMYNRLLEGLGEKDQEILRNAVEGWLSDFGKNLLDPLASQVGSKDFKDKLERELKNKTKKRVARDSSKADRKKNRKKK